MCKSIPTYENDQPDDNYYEFTQEEVDELMGNEPVTEWTEEDEAGWQEVIDWDKWDTDE